MSVSTVYSSFVRSALTRLSLVSHLAHGLDDRFRDVPVPWSRQPPRVGGSVRRVPGRPGRGAFATFGGLYREGIQDALDRSVSMPHVHSVRAELADNVTDAAAVGGAMAVPRDASESPEIADVRTSGW